ncbi:hypothetical protein HPB49_015995 [Dermacentor silvarum]|uniref:Uncharacterized protein n=1 Tax=Dermacentor silvarum TaxID=543639 RepID=A0ACB8C4G5_DERSI|nr:hypothetical protein HPB49_015995 [Dermacentor silvarum]
MRALVAQVEVAEERPPDGGEYSLLQAAFVWILGAVVGGALGFTCVMLLESSASHLPEHKTTPTAREPPLTSSPNSVSSTSTAISTDDTLINRTVCFSPQCLRASRRLQKLLNPLADPCRNWYEHVCGRFRGPQASVRQLMDTAVTEFVTNSLLSFGENPPPGIAGSADARFKAANLLLACESHGEVFAEEIADVTDFMIRHKLDLVVSASNGVTADEALSKHVELAFSYGLSGLMTLSPGPQTLTLDVDSSFEVRITEFTALGASELAEYLINLADFVGQPQTEVKAAVALHNTVVAAVASIMVDAHLQTKSTPRRSIARELKASEVMFQGVGSSAFGEAVESKTPYSRDTDVDSSYAVLLVLEAVWKTLSPAEIVAWTAWAVLHECGSVAVSDLVAYFGRNELSRKCTLRVRHAMSVPFDAVALYDVITRKIQNDVTAMAKDIFECLATNASRWLRRPLPSPPTVIVGFPPGRDTVAGTDAYYEAFPLTVPPDFFKQWVAAEDARKDKLLPMDVHFDPAGTDVIVSKQGIVLVPAGIFKTDLYEVGGVNALNMGGLGHVIAKAIVRRRV